MGTRRGDVEHILQFGTGSDQLRTDLLLPVIVHGQLPDQALLLSVEQSRAGSGLCLNVLWKLSGRARGIPNGVRNRKDGNGQEHERPHKTPFQRALFLSHFHEGNVLGISDHELDHARNPQR